MKRPRLLPIGAMLLVIVLGCETGSSQMTINWEVDGNGFRQFMTNNSAYQDYSFWLHLQASERDRMTEVETQVKKMSGSESGGYGTLFCLEDYNSFYVYVINVLGRYAVYKREDGIWSTIIGEPEWVASSHLKTGFNTPNTLKVSFDGVDTFELYANGIPINTFTDDSFTGGYSGYECQVSGAENFPEVPEDFRFKQLQPTVDP